MAQVDARYQIDLFAVDVRLSRSAAKPGCFYKVLGGYTERFSDPTR